MHITDTTFVRSIAGSDPILEDERTHVAFVGRSNVGKSSVINTLLGRKDLAHSSNTPGKTQRINFYLVNKCVYFVDLPGYGYAKMPAKRADRIRKQMIWYLGKQKRKPSRVVLVLDAKAGITDIDRDMLDIVSEENYRILVLINKIDKLNQSKSAKIAQAVSATIAEYTFSEAEVVPFSARTGEGKQQALTILEGVFN